VPLRFRFSNFRSFWTHGAASQYSHRRVVKIESERHVLVLSAGEVLKADVRRAKTPVLKPTRSIIASPGCYLTH